MIQIKQKSESLFAIRVRNFKKIKRGYYSFLIIVILYILSFFNPIFINNHALIVKFNGKLYFPAFSKWLNIKNNAHYDAHFFNQKEVLGKKYFGEPNYRELKKTFKKETSGNFVILPIYPYGPNEVLLSEMESNPPDKPSLKHIFGIDNQGRDVFARLAYGFFISISFALIITFCSYLIGIIIGAILGYFGGKIDLIGVRIIEIISAIPFLYMTMILVSMMKPSFFLLSMLLILIGGWIGISYYVRGEFLREKCKDYVLSAVSLGASNFSIIFKHILPNSLTPVITFAPFAIVGYISALVSLDFLGLGLPPPTPSFGELLNQGVSDITYWWLTVMPLTAIFFTMLMIIFIGEAIHESFDPKSYAKYE